MIDLWMRWDEEEDPRAEASDPYGLLARFLESEVQGSQITAERFLQAVDQMAAGHLQEWSETGNALTLQLTMENARIESEVDEQAKPCEMDLIDFKAAVEHWLAFLNTRQTAIPDPT